jgi:SAM-dependent methyltransferase
MHRFFEPSDTFLDWLADYAGDRVVFDVGCGACHVTLALRARQVKALGIDPRYDWIEDMPRELMNAVLPFMAQECKPLLTTKNSLVLFCRPCHDGFVQDTIPMLPTTAEVLYISIPDNTALDLDGFCYTEVVEAPPCEVEKVFRVHRRNRC